MRKDKNIYRHILLEISSFPGCFAWHFYVLVLYSSVDFVPQRLQNRKIVSLAKSHQTLSFRPANAQVPYGIVFLRVNLVRVTYEFLYFPLFGGPVHHRWGIKEFLNITQNSPEMKRARGVHSPGVQKNI